MDVLNGLAQLGLSDVLDIAVVAIILGALIRGIRKSRSAFVLTGFVMVSSLYVVARLLGLHLVTLAFQSFFPVLLVAVIVIFQEDLRRVLERVARRGLGRRRAPGAPANPARGMAELLVRTLADLARDRVGVILVLQGRDSVLRHAEGGIPIDARPSEPLLKSLFDPHSIGHDGAVVLVGERIVQFSCRLPLSSDDEQLGGRGTRHAAALGLAERTDALCLVVSEERGTISVARDGQLATLQDASQLGPIVEQFVEGGLPAGERRSWTHWFRDHPAEKAAALVTAVLLWFFFVRESEVVYRSFAPRIDHAGLPETLAVAAVTPPAVRVILSGPRRSFYFVDDDDLTLTVKLFDAGAGTRQVALAAPDIAFPPGLTFVNVIPREVALTIAPAARAEK